MTAIIIPGQHRENKPQDLMMLAADRAQDYMKRLFAGKVKVVCECGKKIKVHNDCLHCDECGTDLGVVGYIMKYGELYVRTVVDIAAKRFRLAIHTNPEKFEDLE